MDLTVKKSRGLKGEVHMPRSKTHSFRALILASVARGTSIINKPKLGNDWDNALMAMQSYGAKIKKTNSGSYEVTGAAGGLKTPDDIINVNNSGTMLFFALGIASACPGWSIITGDLSLRTVRSTTANLIKPLSDLGITIMSARNNGLAPFMVKGPVVGGKTIMDGSACQPVFSLLIAGALAKNPVDIKVTNPGETAYIDLLLHWFSKGGIKFENVNNKYSYYHFPGSQLPKPFTATMPFEWSAPAYPLLAAVITPDSEITVRGMDMTDPYGDKEVMDVLQRMGAKITVKGNCMTAVTSHLHGIEVDLNRLPDQLPTVAVAGCFADGRTIIKNTKVARFKECDRISAICRELSKMGAKISEKPDGLVINQDNTWRLKGTKLSGYQDHRMVLCGAVAGLNATGTTIISDAQMLEKSFETFVPEMRKAGANLALN